MSDTYYSQLRVPAGPRATLEPLRAPVADASAIGTALQQFGQAAAHFEAVAARGRSATEEATVKSQYLQGLSELRDGATRSEDFRTAPAAFEEKRAELETRLLGTVPDERKRAELRLYMDVHGLSAAKEVKVRQLGNEADYNVAELDKRSADYVRRAAAAATPVERDAIFQSWNADIKQAAAAGWITNKEAVRREITGKATVDDADVLALIRVNPAAAAKALSDPATFPNLGPVQRENLINQARAAVDTAETIRLRTRGAFDPAGAIAEIGRVTGRADADLVFERGVVPIESAGKADAVSTAGALGLAQLMPDTARKQARRLGLRDVAGLDDAALKQRLLTDTALNLRLGKAEWHELLIRYNGNIAAAAAGYNAGPGNAEKPRADAWYAQAIEKFGPNFTPEQFASLIPIAETKNYIGKLYKQLNAPLSGTALSPAAAFNAGASVLAAQRQQEAERVAAIRAIASIGRETQDPATLFQSGYNQDPAQYAAWALAQRQAAAAGDLAAAKALRTAEFQREMLPFRQQALRSSPAEIEAFVEAEEAALRGLAHVPLDRKNRLDVAREMLKAVRQARDDNPVGLVEEAGFVPEGQRVAIDPRGDPAGATFQTALSVRGAQANAAAQRYLGKALALKPNELAAIKERWGNAGANERFELLQAFGQALDGRAFTDTLAAVTGNAAMAPVIAQLSRTRPDVAREVLAGSALLATKEVATRAQDIRTTVSQAFGGLVYPVPAMQDQAIQAALAVYVSRRSAGGELYDSVADTTALQGAIEAVTGPIVRRNGQRLPIAPGLAQGPFLAALDNLSDDDVATQGLAFDRSGAALPAATIASRGIFKPTAVGSPLYIVGLPDARARDGFAPVMSFDGNPLVFDMRVLTQRSPAAQAVPFQSLSSEAAP